MYEVDYGRTELLVNSIIAFMAIAGTVASLAVVAWQIRHQNRTETKRVEHECLRDLLRLLDGPLDLAVSNAVEVDYIRSGDPALLETPEKLQQARPYFASDIRNAYQQFTNAACTIRTVLPACRRSRGASTKATLGFLRLQMPLGDLVQAYERLGRRYGHAAALRHLGLAQLYSDEDFKEVMALVVVVRSAASDLLAQLYA